MPVILPDDMNAEQEEVINYQPTDKDEESFFLMYFLHLQPSEISAMTDDYRKWLLARFIGQKQMEQEAMRQQRMAQSVAQGLDLSKLKI